MQQVYAYSIGLTRLVGSWSTTQLKVLTCVCNAVRVCK